MAPASIMEKLLSLLDTIGSLSENVNESITTVMGKPSLLDNSPLIPKKIGSLHHELRLALSYSQDLQAFLFVAEKEEEANLSQAETAGIQAPTPPTEPEAAEKQGRGEVATGVLIDFGSDMDQSPPLVQASSRGSTALPDDLLMDTKVESPAPVAMQIDPFSRVGDEAPECRQPVGFEKWEPLDFTSLDNPEHHLATEIAQGGVSANQSDSSLAKMPEIATTLPSTNFGEPEAGKSDQNSSLLGNSVHSMLENRGTTNTPNTGQIFQSTNLGLQSELEKQPSVQVGDLTTEVDQPTEEIEESTVEILTIIEPDQSTINQTRSSNEENDAALAAAASMQGLEDEWEFAGVNAFQERSLSELAKGGLLDCKISYASNQADFWVVLKQELRDYERMDETLSLDVQIMQMENIGIKNFKKGLPCIAMYSTDNMYYRAQIVVDGLEDCLVRFVDYGNEGMVHKKQLYPLPRHFLDKPKAAFRCCLKGVDTRELTQEMIENFTIEWNEGCKVLIQPIRSKPADNPDEPCKWVVDLRDRRTRESVNERYRTKPITDGFTEQSFGGNIYVQMGLLGNRRSDSSESESELEGAVGTSAANQSQSRRLDHCLMDFLDDDKSESSYSEQRNTGQ